MQAEVGQQGSRPFPVGADRAAAVATYERIRSRKGRRYFADVNKMMPVVVVVLALVGFLFFTGLYLDIAKPL